jgi:hypothetical protein
MSRRDFVDLTSDETTDIAPPRKQSVGRPASTPLTDRGKHSSHVRVEEQTPRTRTPQMHSQKSTPVLTRDKSPLKKSKTTHDTPSSNHDPAISGISIAKSHVNNSRVPEAGGDVLRYGTSKLDLAQSGALRSSPPLRSSLSMDTAKDDLSHFPDDNFAKTSLPPRLILRGPSGDAPLPTKGYGTRGAGFRSSDTRETEEGSSSDSRPISRRVSTGNPINLLNRELGGEPKRRINRSRLGVSFSGQLHIDGEDSDNDNAARAMRHSINAVIGPLRKQSEESEISEEEIIPKMRVASHKKANVATGSRRQRSEGRNSSGNDDLQEAASAQLLNDVLEHPAKPDPPRSELGKLLFPSSELDNDMTVDEPRLGLKTPHKDQRTHKAQRTPNPMMEPTKTEALGEQAQGNISEDDPSLRQTKLVLDDAIDSNPVLSKRPVPLGIESLTAMLRRHEIAMWNDQAYLIKPALRQAKLDCIQAAQPKLDQSLPDPFSGILGDSFLPTEKVQIDVKNQGRSKLQSRVFNSSYTQHTDGLIYFDNIEYASTVSALPKYKSIVRLGPNILAKNDRALKYMPYFTSEEDPQSRQKKELLDELQKRYDDRVETLPAQRKCSELAEFWRECVEDFLSEIEIGVQEVAYFVLYDSTRPSYKSPAASHEICPSCKTSCPREDWDDLLGCIGTDALPQPDERKLALAGLACQVFLDVAKFSIWHIAFTAPRLRQLLQSLKQNAADSMKPRTLCLICYLHDCPTHGAYLERAPGSESGSDSSEDSENDGELGHNIRQRVTLSGNGQESTGDHRCGIYCIGPEIESRDILGLHPDGEVKGVVNTAVLEDLPEGFEDNQLCSDDCFWAVDKRNHASTMTASGLSLSLSAEKMSMYQTILPTFRNNRRGPCMIALGLGRVSCLDVFRQMRSDASAVQEHTSTLDRPVAADGKRSQNFDHEGENSNTHHLDNRIPFIPCSHAGPCDKDAGCSCNSNRTSCERMCGCAKTCGRRYQGCTCGAKNNSVCFQDQRCMCWRLNRECDPWLCGTCGVLEVLDPVNRYNDEIQSSHCKNAKLQRDVPRRTLKGKSDVQGWGLFAGEDMKKHEYIGEYKGEVVGEQESNRRGAVYHHRGLEYLFNLNKGQEIDSSRAGNKMRFINNSCKPHIINVEAKKMFCNGVQRIMLFSKKHIDAGEELFFNYGYPKSVTKNFWERDEGPGQQGGEEDELIREEAAGAVPTTTTRGPGRPRKKGVGRKISSKKQSRSGGRWVKSALEVESLTGVADSDEEAHSSRTENNGGSLRSSSRRKRKRSEGGHEVNKWGIPADEPDVVEGHGDGNGAAGSSLQRAPEIAESGDDEFEDDLASQESSSTGDSDEEDDLEEEEEEEVTSDSEVVRQRRISAGDTRYGGKSQRAGWATRRLKAAQAAEIALAPRPKKTRGKRSARGSWLGTGGRPPKKRGK